MNKTPDDRRINKALSPKERETLAEAWLRAANELRGAPVDILKVLRCGGIDFIERSLSRLNGDRAQARAQVRTIFVCPELFRALHNGCRTAAMEMSHELGHCIFNEGTGPKALKISGNAKLSWIPEGEGEETVAWQIGRALMMPRLYIADTDTPKSISHRFDVPIDEAEKRFAELRLERRKGLQDVPEPERRRLPELAERAWRLAAIAPAYDPDFYRLSPGDKLIAHVGYDDPRHAFSWTLYNAKIYAKGDFDPSWF